MKSEFLAKNSLFSLSVPKEFSSATTLWNFTSRHCAGPVCTVGYGRKFLCTVVKKVSAFGFRNYSWRLGLGDKSKVSNLSRVGNLNSFQVSGFKWFDSYCLFEI